MLSALSWRTLMCNENQPLAKCFYILPHGSEISTLRPISQISKLSFKEAKATPCITMPVRNSEGIQIQSWEFSAFIVTHSIQTFRKHMEPCSLGAHHEESENISLKPTGHISNPTCKHALCSVLPTTADPWTVRGLGHQHSAQWKMHV